jgi:NAD(P)-dependent dehydrogenase (short-subunit alcohol dehydrogenase family)
MQDLEGKVVLVTGGGGGIGRKTGAHHWLKLLAILAPTSPQKRLIEPEDVAHLALMLASESAKGITGQAINVDGGAVMI